MEATERGKSEKETKGERKEVHNRKQKSGTVKKSRILNGASLMDTIHMMLDDLKNVLSLFAIKSKFTPIKFHWMFFILYVPLIASAEVSINFSPRDTKDIMEYASDICRRFLA